ncbi:hypothetical protein BJY00DRAFT_316438 [Aspergillus carlsbadensis]|nr:hypothetical protein BJY00DRAFT_316438 [Aspergillus carlsbadensis]
MTLPLPGSSGEYLEPLSVRGFQGKVKIVCKIDTAQIKNMKVNAEDIPQQASLPKGQVISSTATCGGAYTVVRPQDLASNVVDGPIVWKPCNVVEHVQGDERVFNFAELKLPTVRVGINLVTLHFADSLAGPGSNYVVTLRNFYQRLTKWSH